MTQQPQTSESSGADGIGIGGKRVDEWVLGPEDTPFFTSTWSPKEGDPKAYVLFVHGFSEHITRYNAFFTLLSSPPYSLHILAFDQRGHGRTAHEPLSDGSPEVQRWKAEGKKVAITKAGDTKRRTGGWGKVFVDMEFFVKRLSETSRAKGKGVWLWGFSMGGAQVLGFCTAPTLGIPPKPNTLSLLSGVISGGPLIRQTSPAPWLQLTAGSLASKFLPNQLIPTPLKYADLSHNEESNDINKADPLCEQVGSLRGVADMLNGGAKLDSKEAWDKWDEKLPLMVYHGEEDRICDPKAAERFYEGVKVDKKKFELVKGMYHEVHNELPPVPENLAKVIADFILETPDRTAQGIPAGEGQHNAASKL